MVRVLGLLLRFKRDESGVFAVIFGLMAIVLIAFGGAVVDYVAVEQNRGRAQIALDAAALALQPKIYTTGVTRAVLKANLQAQAQALMLDRLGTAWGVTAKIIDTQIDTDEGSLYFRAAITVPTMFVSLVGVKQLDAQIQSEATRKKLALEIAFVLDNSGSMVNTGAGKNGTRQRMQFLKDAANCAVNIMFYKDTVDPASNPDTCVKASGATQLEDVKIGVVPFTMFVNVGASNANAAWIDKGTSVIANDNFDDGRTPPGNIARQTLFTATDEDWAGCVEARPHIKTGSRPSEYLDTDDTAPAAGNTLFVPMFAPDIEDYSVDNANKSDTNNYLGDTPAVCNRPATSPMLTTCTVLERRSSCNSTMTNGGTCNTITQVSGTPAGPINFVSSTLYPNAYYGGHAPTCSCTSASGTWVEKSGTNSNRTFERAYACNNGYIPGGLTTRQLQERVCKYYGTMGATGNTRGPNADCGKSVIVPLSATPATVTAAISNMVALGGTNIHEGAAWGYRVLSPDQPFVTAPYGEATGKIMIIMTDGENTTYNLSNPNYCNSTNMRPFNGSCYNSAYGYPYNSRNTTTNSSSAGDVDRLGTFGTANANLVTAMNQRTIDTCTNAKADGIVVYTIGLATAESTQSTKQVVQDMLTQCASTPDKARFPDTPGELKQIFQDIANELTSLRISR